MVGEAIYFLSDTHLGDGTGADRFRFPRALVQLLSRIDSEPGAHLVLLGDLMELWATTLEPILVHHAPIFYALGRLAAHHPVTYVVGNHDCLPWYYFVGNGAGNIQVAERFTAARGTLVALHGHQYDPFNQVQVDDGTVRVPWVRRLVQVLGFLGRVSDGKVVEAMDDAGAAIERAAASVEHLLPDWSDDERRNLCAMLEHTREVLGRQSPGDRGYPLGERYYENAARELMRKGARFVVMGHTHHPLKHLYGNRTYVNTGSWVSDRYPPTYARFAGGKLELLHGETHLPYQPPDVQPK